MPLRPVIDTDIAVFYEHQLDDGARAMVGYEGEPAQDRRSFEAKWDKIRVDEKTIARAIALDDGAVAGYLVSFERFELREVGYFLGRAFWSRGIATAALSAFLQLETRRPLYARVSKRNAGSLRVVQKNGFVILRDDKWTPPTEGAPEIEEWVLILDRGR